MKLVLLLTSLFASFSSYAHKPSDSYVALRIEGEMIHGQWDIALRDLDYAIGLDENGDGVLTWKEIKAKHSAIEAYALSRLKLVAQETCPARAEQHLIDTHSDGAYAVLKFTAICQRPVDELAISYNLLFDADPQHKGLFRLRYQNTTKTAIFSSETREQRISLTQPSWLHEFFEYGREGVWHIWLGWDHILFLFSLLLPAVLIRHAGQWQGVAGGKPAFWEVVKIVTAFTIAHSITLSLASLGVISLPARLTESAIALSVILAALNNIYPLVEKGRWMVAFAFGLIHGFGFASVLSDLGLPKASLLLALVGFNLGVEAGQLLLVGLFFPVALKLRHNRFYSKYILLGGSLLIAILASVWFIERAWNLKLITL